MSIKEPDELRRAYREREYRKKYGHIVQQLNDILSNELVTVTFLKNDGTERVLHCTRNQDYIRKHYGGPTVTASGRTKKISVPSNKMDGLFKVYDIENKGWRSFKINSVTNIQPYDSRPLVERYTNN